MKCVAIAISSRHVEVAMSSKQVMLVNQLANNINDKTSQLEELLNKEIEDLRLENNRLKNENKTYHASKNSQEILKGFLTELLHVTQTCRVALLNDRLGKETWLTKCDHEIVLTKRESSILYLLSLNKSPKEIAAILMQLENKNITDSTVAAIINKHLYIKFDVFNISGLIEKATMLNLIPFMLVSY